MSSGNLRPVCRSIFGSGINAQAQEFTWVKMTMM
jgi:hypothetical protein